MTTYQELATELNFTDFAEFAEWMKFYDAERPTVQAEETVAEHECSAARQWQAQGHKA